jgi:Amt family ammonium transporter
VVVSPALGGVGVDDYDMGSQVMTQTLGVLVAIGWSGVVSLVLFKLIDMTMGLRVAEEEEREGLDITSHGETAYHL